MDEDVLARSMEPLDFTIASVCNLSMLKFIISLLLVTLTSHAGELHQKCTRDFWDQVARDLKSDKDAKKMQAISVSNQYLRRIAIESCVLEGIQTRFKDDVNLHGLCPKSDSGLKIDCYREWTARREINYSGLIGIFDAVATSVAAMDKNAGADQTEVTLHMIDANLVPLENLKLKHNVAFTPLKVTPRMRQIADELKRLESPDVTMKVEQQRLQQVEREMFAKSKDRILPQLEGKLSNLRASAPSKELSLEIESLEERIQKVRAREL